MDADPFESVIVPETRDLGDGVLARRAPPGERRVEVVPDP